MCDKTYTYTYDTEWFVKMGYNYALYISALGVGIGYQIVSDTSKEKVFNDYYACNKGDGASSAEKGLNMIYNSKENYFLSDKDSTHYSYTKEIPFFSTGEKIDIDHIFFQFKTVRPICIKIYVTNSEPEEINTNHDYNVIKLLKQFDYFNEGENHINTYYFYKTPEKMEKYNYKYWGYNIFALDAYPYDNPDNSSNRSGYPLFTNNSSIIFGDTAVFDYGTVGLNFDTPPDDGISIILDAGLDYPYIDENVSFVINSNCEVQPAW